MKQKHSTPQFNIEKDRRCWRRNKRRLGYLSHKTKDWWNSKSKSAFNPFLGPIRVEGNYSFHPCSINCKSVLKFLLTQHRELTCADSTPHLIPINSSRRGCGTNNIFNPFDSNSNPSSLPCRTFLSQLILHNDLEALLNTYYSSTLVVLYKTINSVDDEDNNLVKNWISDCPWKAQRVVLSQG